MQPARVPGKVSKGRYLRLRVLTRAKEVPGEKIKPIQRTTTTTTGETN